MRQLELSAAEVQSLIAPALIDKLKAEGFKFGLASDEHSAYWLPVRIDFSGACELEYHADGTWTFTQYDDVLEYERTKFADQANIEAFNNREQPPCR